MLVLPFGLAPEDRPSKWPLGGETPNVHPIAPLRRLTARKPHMSSRTFRSLSPCLSTLSPFRNDAVPLFQESLTVCPAFRGTVDELREPVTKLDRVGQTQVETAVRSAGAGGFLHSQDLPREVWTGLPP